MEKQALRRRMRACRNALSPQQQAELSESLLRTLCSWLRYQQAPLIAPYVSMPSEADTHALLQQVLADGKQLVVPRCLSKETMAFYQLESLTQLEPGAYGILEPKTECRLITQFPPGSICIVPGLAFDRHGGRLGYGAGYYDRFLSAHPELIPVGYCSEAFVLPKVPMEATDCRMQYLLTEHKVEVIHGI